MLGFWYEKIEGPYLHYITHFLAGFMIATLFARFFGLEAGFKMAVVAAAGKEAADKITGQGSPELKAAIITIAGAALAISL